MDNILKLFCINVRKLLDRLNIQYEKLQEIRLRSNKPIIILYDNKEWFLGKDGNLTVNIYEAYIMTNNDVKETMEYVSNYSLYAYEEEIKQGFITVQGGHRVGICGKVVMESKGIKTIKYISFLNIRIAHEVIGCSNSLLKYVIDKENKINNTLIISPPRCGKTTILRDLIRNISDGVIEKNGDSLKNITVGQSVGIVDERSEIAGSYLGIPQNDIGIRTDVLDGVPKSIGIMMLVRTMSPRVIAIDEIGSLEDIEAVAYGINCGCCFLGTVHGASIEEISRKPLFNKMLEWGVFERYIVLDSKIKVGTIKGVYNQQLKLIG